VEPLSVTDNWTSAYAASTGQYIVLIGDDDFLLPGYLSKVRALLEDHAMPSCLTYSAYSFAWPSALAATTYAYYAAPHFAISQALLDQRQLSRQARTAIVADMFRFRPRLPLNLQTTIFARKAADALPHGLFKPPFPDHYALNGLLMTAPSWACSAERLLVIGVSPKSFGRYFFAGQSDQGLKYLGSELVLPGSLPGNDLLTAMYRWLMVLQEDFPLAAQMRISRGDYVIRQLWDWLRAWRLGLLPARAVLARFRLLETTDWLEMARLGLDREIWRAADARMRLRRDQTVQHVWLGMTEAPPSVRTLPEFAAFVGTLGEARKSEP
jgi:hypothetical protein